MEQYHAALHGRRTRLAARDPSPRGAVRVAGWVQVREWVAEPEAGPEKGGTAGVEGVPHEHPRLAATHGLAVLVRVRVGVGVGVGVGVRVGVRVRVRARGCGVGLGVLQREAGVGCEEADGPGARRHVLGDCTPANYRHVRQDLVGG